MLKVVDSALFHEADHKAYKEFAGEPVPTL